jgi:hypothetical protein
LLRSWVYCKGFHYRIRKKNVRRLEVHEGVWPRVSRPGDLPRQPSNTHFPFT